jgi:2-polyprenyl-6-methoxyphenol hydroxylase-like FAD-dependent oxidoreductase
MVKETRVPSVHDATGSVQVRPMPMTNETPAGSSAAELTVDVAIIGAGAAGCAAAAALVKAKHTVALIDLHARASDEFRAEKIGVRQVNYLNSFGFEDMARQVLTAFDGVWVHRYGRIIEKKQSREFGAAYGDLVNGMRRALPPEVNLIIGRVDTMETGADNQHLVLSDGRRITARLLIVATGLIDVARRKLGIEKRVISAEHSLTFGFDIVGTPADFPFPSLVWYIDRPADKGAYLSFFPIQNRVRANLFTYRRMSDPWVKEFKLDPAGGLHKLLPDLEGLFGRVKVEDAVSARPIDLMETTNYQQPGVVLVGDAFFTSCPTTGTGIDKAFNDVDILVNRHVSNWLASPGMGLEKIAQFYADPDKVQRDFDARRSSLRSRSMRMDHGPMGIAQRAKHLVLTRGVYELRELSRSLGGVARTGRQA